MDKPLQQTRQLALGDKLGKYELIRHIATAGMAELYLARTEGFEGSEKLAVIKRILPKLATSSSNVEVFLDEARLAATIVHPNVAQVYDIGHDGEYFLAREYVYGERLDRVESRAREQGVPFSLDAALTLVAGVCAGLHHAHEMVDADGKPLQIVHRDVAPSNVLVSHEGTVKLVDFGVARATGKGSPRRRLTGHVAYMSPEQCKPGTVIDRRSDIYEVGTLLYELTTGHTPFTGENELAILDHIVNVDVPPPTWFVPDYPPTLEKIVLRALSRDREARYPTALQLQTELEDFAFEQRLRVSPLVLAQLMSTLFPARLEEWAQAKSQGAHFINNHVVQTLIANWSTSEDTLEFPAKGNIPPSAGPAEADVPAKPAVEAAIAIAEPLARGDVAPVVRRRTSRSRKSHAPLFVLVALLLGGGGIAVYYGLGGGGEPTADRSISRDEPKPPAPIVSPIESPAPTPPADPPTTTEGADNPTRPADPPPRAQPIPAKRAASKTLTPNAASPDPDPTASPRPPNAASPDPKPAAPPRPPNATSPDPKPTAPPLPPVRDPWETGSPLAPVRSDNYR